jgi:dimethylhistidine N-methyltransferase
MAQVSESSAHRARRAASDGTPCVRVGHVDSPAERRAELLAGLMKPQATIAPKYFYDEQGAALYEAIVALEEYYPPRVEAAIFAANHADIAAALPEGGQWVDLGCGDGHKSWPWLETLAVRRYVGVDFAERWLRTTLKRAAAQFPQIAFEGVVTDFTRGLALHEVLGERREMPCTLFYPGSSIGNFEPPRALALLRAMREHLGPEDRVLIGVDGVKAERTLVAAYDDVLGVTAAFNRNALRVVNRELGAQFDVAAFGHRALFDTANSRIEMHLVASEAQRMRIDEHERMFDAGESIVTEHSYKYTADDFAAMLHDAGFRRLRHWTDADRWFHVFVAAP